MNKPKTQTRHSKHSLWCNIFTTSASSSIHLLWLNKVTDSRGLSHYGQWKMDLHVYSALQYYRFTGVSFTDGRGCHAGHRFVSLSTPWYFSAHPFIRTLAHQQNSHWGPLYCQSLGSSRWPWISKWPAITRESQLPGQPHKDTVSVTF